MRSGITALRPVICLLFFGAAAYAAVEPASLFTDNAVLQRETEVPVWGTAQPGERVTVSIQGQQVSTSAASDGKWMVRLRPLREGGPFVMTIRASNTVELKNILVGEVWLASGQSNMAWILEKSEDGERAVQESSDANMRLFTVPVNSSPEPVSNVESAWVECRPETSRGFSAVAYYFGRSLRKTLGCPVGMIVSAVGGTRVEAWTDPALLPDSAKQVPERIADGVRARLNSAGGLYNGMIRPLVPYAIRGAIWYQGEANRFNANEYTRLFPAMIRGWRSDWGLGDFPFLYVQIAPYTAIVSEPSESEWADIREAQRLVSLRERNVAMAVITDHGDETNVHPKQKQPVGERLALAARALAYGEKIPFRGPVFKEMKVVGSQALVLFECTDGGLVAKGGRLKGFTVAGSDRKFYNASAVIEGDTVRVWSPDVRKPAAVRFGWAAYPVVNLYSGSGLPASPFCTDNWPRSSEQRADEPGTILAGYGRACVTPPVGTPAGKGIYGRIEAIVEDIFARAIFIQAGQRKTLICAADVVGFYPTDVDYFTARISEATGLARDQIIIHATHNHSGPNSRWEIGEILEPYGLSEANASSLFRAILADGFAAAAKQAVESAEPCRMAYSEAPVSGVASNRRVPVEGTDKVVMRNSRPKDELRLKPEGVIDPLVRVVLFKAVSGKSLIGICNYNCHPSAGGGDMAGYLSADFPGYAMKLAESRVRGLKLIHLTGTCGDINPGAHVTSSSTSLEDRRKDIVLLGTRYADGILGAVKAAGNWQAAASMDLRHAAVDVPLASDRLPAIEYKAKVEEAVRSYKETGKAPAELYRLLQHYHARLRERKGCLPTRLSAMRLGENYLTFLPGEIFLRFGQALREVVPGHLLNTAVCHDYSVNYVVPPECFAEGGYEPTATRLAPEAYGKLLDAAKSLLGSVKSH